VKKRPPAPSPPLRSVPAPRGGIDEPVEAARSAETLARRLHRLALDVHDGPMQNLTVIGFGINDLRRRMRTLVAPEHLTKLDASLQQITDELGKVENDLRLLIGTLEGGGAKNTALREAIEAEISEFERRFEAQVAFAFDDGVHAETDSQRIALQSVARAALANVAKHAGATRVTVRLHGTPEVTTLEIEDNGRGFRAELPPKRGRIGLAGMRRRVELLGGEFRIASRLGGPTTVTASLQSWRPADDPGGRSAAGAYARAQAGRL
jgi:signal transduction histidine kinase